MVVLVTPDPARRNGAVEQPAEASHNAVLTLENPSPFPTDRPWQIVQSSAQRVQHLTGQPAHRLVARALIEPIEGLGLEAQILRGRGQRAVELRRMCPEPPCGAEVRANERLGQIGRLARSERGQ